MSPNRFPLCEKEVPDFWDRPAWQATVVYPPMDATLLVSTHWTMQAVLSTVQTDYEQAKAADAWIDN